MQKKSIMKSIRRKSKLNAIHIINCVFGKAGVSQRVIVLLTCAFSAYTAFAQNITGKVVDENNKPMEFVNVVLLTCTDSAYIAGTVTQEDGRFTFEDKDTASCLVRLSSIGYAMQVNPVPPSGNMGTIVMSPESVMLGEVVVKSSRPVTAIKGNALVTNVENSALAHAGTANDVLSQVPMVMGQDGKFEVFGKGTPLIYINGRQVRDTEELSQLNSQDIRSVEVITNPGARYDASVKSIIRIRTRQPQGEGFSGTLRAQNGFAHYFRYGEQINLKYRTQGLELFANMGYYGGKSYDTSDNDMATQSQSIWRQFYNETTRGTYNDFTGKIGFDYMINEKHSVGAYYQNGQDKHTDRADYHSDILEDDAPYDSWKNQSESRSSVVPKHSANVYYNGSVGKLDIDFNMDYMWNKNSRMTFNQEQSENFNDADVETRSSARSRLFAEKLILSYPLWKGEIEVGHEYTNSRLSTGFNTTTDALIDATTQVDENNNAFFIQLSQQLGRFKASAGLRYEHVNFDYYADGQYRPEQSKTYNNVFPSLALSTQWGQVQTALSYTAKTLRPNYSHLDGTVNYINRFTYKSGNPYLKPTTLHTVELMAAWQMLFAQISYNYAKNPIYNATQPYYEDERIQLITYENFAKNQSLSAFLGINLQCGIWKPRLNAGITKQWFSVPCADGQKEMGKPMPLVQFQNAIQLPGDIWLNLDAQWRGCGDTENVSLRSSSYVNAKLYKAFFHDCFSVTVEAKDLFNKNYERLTFYNGSVMLDAVNRGDSRSLFVTLQYKFNTSRDRYKGRGAGQAEKDRF